MILNKKILLFLFLGLWAIPLKSEAQFWKKIFQKEEKRPVRPPVQKQNKTAENKDAPKREPLDYPASVFKSRYRVDVLVPLYLDELVRENKVSFKDKLPEKAVSGISFCQGIRLAADTLNALGYQLDVYIHDISQPGLSPEDLVKNKLLASSDLIIGAIQSGQISPVASFAKKNQTNLISAISPSDAEVKNNIFFTMLQPTLQEHCRQIKNAALSRFPGQKPLVLYRDNNGVDSLAASYLLADEEQKFKTFSLNRPVSKESIERLIDTMRTNLVFMPLVDNNFAESQLRQLSEWFPQVQFEVYGLPTWKFIGSLRKAEAFPNVAVNFTSPFYYDLSTPAGQALQASYKKQFAGRTDEMVFRGYEILYWYANLLHKYGTVYNQRQGDNFAAPFTKFKIKPVWLGPQFLYNENQHLYFFRYQAGSYMVNP